MLTLSAKIDTRAVLSALARERKQVAFAASLAINEVAKAIKPAETRLLATTFEHPRPFTVNSVVLGPAATKARLERAVSIKPITSAYLGAYERGGEHYLPNRPELGRVVLEPVHIKVDAYGQIRKAYLDQLLARPDVFVATIHQVLGIWQRVKPPRRQGILAAEMTAAGVARPRLLLLAKVIPNRPVPKHLGFVEQGLDIAEYLMPGAFARAFDKAMATAK